MAKGNDFRQDAQAKMADELLAQATRNYLNLVKGINDTVREMNEVKARTLELRKAFEATRKYADPAHVKAFNDGMADLAAKSKDLKTKLASQQEALRDTGGQGQMLTEGKRKREEDEKAEKEREKEKGKGGGLAQAIGALKDPLQVVNMAASQLRGFVEAVNPSTVLVFDQAMRDLHATVGVALTPIFETLTEAVRQASSLMLPLAQSVAPIFSQLSQAALGVLQPVMQTFAASMEGALPAFRMFVGLLDAVAQPVRAVGTVFAALARTTSEFFQKLYDPSRTGVDGFRVAMQKLATFALGAAGALAKMTGNDRLLANLIGAAEGGGDKKKSAVGLGAATAAKTTDLGGFSSSMLSAAFTAAGGSGKEMKSEDWLKEAVGVLKGIQSGEIDGKAWMTREIDKFKVELQKMIEYLAKELKIKETYDKGKQLIDKAERAADVGALALNSLGPFGLVYGAFKGSK